MLSSIAHGTFNYITPKLVTDLHDAESDKQQGKGFQYLDEPHEVCPKTNSLKSPKNSVQESREFKPQNTGIKEMSSSLLFENCQFELI